MTHTRKSGCLGMLLSRFLGSNEEPTVEFPYGKRDRFLSAAELSFFHVLQSILPPETHLVTKVRLLDLFFVRQPQQNRAARNRIDRKHVDFVICDAKTMNPRLAIELDDKSHQRADRRERDAFVDGVFQAAGIPLVHVAAAKGYQVDEIRELIKNAWE